MRRVLAALRRVVGIFTQARAARDFEDELDSHLQLHVDEYLRAGETPAEARRLALAKLGGRQQARERHRDRRGLPFLDQLLQDVRFGVRLLNRNPGFSLFTIATLAIGLGVNVLVFSIGYPIVMAPLPGPDPNRLVRVYESDESNVLFGNYLDFRDHNRTLTGLAATRVEGFSWRMSSGVEHAQGLVVTGDYFGVLGVGAALGRTLTPADDRPDSSTVVMLSHGAWTRRFGRAPDVVGRIVSINGRPFTVIGVVPEQFPGTALPAAPELYVTWHGTELMPSAPQLADGGGRSVQVIGRLRPGVSLSQAQVDLSRVADLITATSRDRGNRTVTIYEGRAVAPGLRSQTLAFMAVVLSLTVLVLGATAINLAALQLARGTARRHEIEVRRALGAGRGRLIRQLLTENLLLSTVACVSALAFVFGGAQVLALWSATTPSGITLTVQPVIAWPVIVFAIVLSLATTVFIGLFPAMKSTRSATSTLAAARASTPGHVRRRPVLTAAQTAGSTLLIVLAAVLLRSLGEAQSIDRGFSTDRIVSGSLDLALRRDTTEQRAEFYSSVIDAAVTTPGVVSAALVEILPLTASSRNRNLLTEGQEAPAGADLSGIRVSTNNVSPGYLGVIGIPLVAGRDFSPRDGHDAPDVAIVNETLARRFWANENPLRRRFRTWDGQRTFSGWIEVIGVARDSKYSTMGEAPRAFFYRPLSQVSTSRVNLLANTVSANPLTVLPALRARLEQLDETVPLFAVDTLERQTGLTLLPVQVTALLAAVLGVVALALTGIGIYGVTSQLVRQRTREAAIRIALGAEPQQVVRAFVRRGLTWALVGLAFGLAGAGAAARLLGSLLYGMNGVDPIAFATATALVATIAYLACWLPARRIVRADPAVTLRAE